MMARGHLRHRKAKRTHRRKLSFKKKVTVLLQRVRKKKRKRF
jgi:hypothetical protein